MKSSLIFLIIVGSHAGLRGQTIDNFVHEPNYVTGRWGQLDINVFGSGAQSMILLAGWGFGAEIFTDFINNHQSNFTIYAVTFPGFGNTPAPPMPDDPGNFRDQYWTNGIVKSLAKLIEVQQLNRPVIMSCFTYSEMIALRLALDYPDKIGKIVVVSGMAKFTGNYPSLEPRSLPDRMEYVENVLSKQWFRTVNRQTWNNGNFAPATFTKDSLKARAYWEQMSSVPIPIMVRYLCEYYCTDVSLEFKDLKVEVLVVLPSFDPETLAKYSYLAPFFHFSWSGSRAASPRVQVVTITGTNAFVMDDQPEKLNSLIKEFLSGQNKFAPIR